MATQLQTYIESNGSTITVKGRSFEVSDISDDGDIAMATFKAKRSAHSGIRCNNTKVAGYPGAEVWSVISHKGREVACFAVENGQIRALTG